MKSTSRFFSSLLSLSIILAAPGLAPYQAAAQTLGAARVAVPAGALGSTGASIHGLGPSTFVLPAASLQTGLVPSLSPSAALTPVMSAPAALSAAVALQPLAVKAAMPAAATAGKSVAPVSALDALKTGSTTLGAAAKAGSADAPRVALDGLFEGSAARPEALAVSGRSAASDSPRLTPSEAREPAQGPRWVKTLLGPKGAAPATSIKRTLSVGLLAAVIPIAITMVSVVVAQLFGYQLHPNYAGPTAGSGSVVDALAMLAGAAIMAPVSEEAIFRGGLQGRLAKLSAKLHLGAFLAPAISTSLVFVAIHETADPVLFATRFVHAMILSYVYQKEGILASMAAHGFFNGLLALPIVLTALGLPWLALATTPVALYFAMRAAKVLKEQKPAVESGALAPKPLSATMAVLFAAMLMLGYFFLMPNIVWPVGAVVLLAAAIRIKMKKS